MKAFEHKKALITGSARGIGKAIAEDFASRGASLALCDIQEEALHQTAQEIKEKYGVDVFISKVDVSRSSEVKNFVKESADNLGGIDILVNNAGITRDKLVMRMSEEDFQSVLQINLMSVFLFSKEVIRPMIKSRGGRIINIASVIGLIGNAGQSNYAASKAGIIGFTKSLAKEVGSRNITVNAIAPGFISTQMTDVLSEEIKQQLKSQIPLQRLGNPRDIAGTVSFLAGEEGAYITGQVINVDGGMVMN